MSLLNKIQQDLQSKTQQVSEDPAPLKSEQELPPELKADHYETDIDALNDRYKMINAICNLEFINTKERINTMLTIQSQTGFTDEQLNELLPIYAPKLINKVVGKYTHLQNILIYAGIRKPDTNKDKKSFDKKRVARNKDNPMLGKWDT